MRTTKLVLAMLFSIAIAACSGGGGGTAAPAATSVTISGSVVKAPVIGATVTFFGLNADGSKATQLGTTTTDGSGSYTITLTPAPTTPFLAETSGGSYVDEVTGLTVILSAADKLTAVLPAGTTGATVTPLTHMAAERAQALAAGGTPLATAVDSSNTGVAQQYGLLDILGTIPGSASDAAQMQTASREERNYSLALAGIAQLANALNVRAIDLAVALATDMKDGILDGMNGVNVIMIPLIGGGTISLTAAMGTTDLQAAINAFIASVINKTNLVMFNIASGAQQVGVNTAGTLYTTSTVLPAWTSGQSGSAQLAAAGGTPPYVCSLKSGSLPTGLSLTPANCTIFGIAPLLGSGITMSISAPFTVTITDSSVPPVSVDIELRITTVAPKPTLIPVAGAMTVNVSGTTQVATATGGTSPYYFAHDSFAYGAHPLGTVLDVNGNLTGTPSQTGTFNFKVCVIDLVGAKNCQMTSVTVNPAETLTVSKAGLGNGAVTSAPSGIDCGANCSASFSSGATVTLTATPDSGSTFSGWSGACAGIGSCVVTMDTAKAVTATFTVNPTCSNGASDYPICTPPTVSDVTPPAVTLGSAGGCAGGTLTGTFQVAAASNVSWSAAGDPPLGGGTVVVSPSSGSGPGTLTVTINVPPQLPSSIYSSCALTYNLNTFDNVYVTFSDGTVVGVTVYWTFIGTT